MYTTLETLQVVSRHDFAQKTSDESRLKTNAVCDIVVQIVTRMVRLDIYNVNSCSSAVFCSGSSNIYFLYVNIFLKIHCLSKKNV